MAVACIFGAPGSGKTVNATLVPGKTLLISSDNSSVVLNNFERPNLTVKPVGTFKEFVATFEDATATHQYDTVIVDCLTDVVDGFITECREANTFPDVRQAYLTVYTKVKYLVRKAAHCQSDVIFTCWEDAQELSLPSGEIITRLSPMLPAKIKQQVCGLCNVIAYVTTANDKSGKKRWYYITEATPALMVKDQLACRKTLMPEDIFNIKK